MNFLIKLALCFVLLTSGQAAVANSVLSDTINTLPITKASLVWQSVGQLPVPEGFKESIGISAAYSAFLGDYLIVAGGANFPKGHPVFDGGKKEYYADIFVFDVSQNKLRLVSTGQLPFKGAYGATVVVEDSLYLVGGQDNEQAFDSILKLTLDTDKKPKTELIAKLPFTWASGGAAWHNDSLYLFAGQQDKKASNQICQYSFDSQTCVNKMANPAIPGVNRIQFPFINHNGHFYVFGGMNFQAEQGNYVLTDNYAFNFNSGRWKTLSSTKINEKTFAVSGGGAAKISTDKLLLLGGVNKALFDDAIYQLKSLKDDKLAAFKQRYFSMSPNEFKFSHSQVIYNINNDSWQVMANELPFPGGAGPLNIEQRDNKVYWISGEIKPVIRSPIVYQGIIN